MKSIKKIFDPHNIFNPGKYFSLKNPHRLHLQYYKFAHGKKVNVPSQQDTKKYLEKKYFFLNLLANLQDLAVNLLCPYNL